MRLFHRQLLLSFLPLLAAGLGVTTALNRIAEDALLQQFARSASQELEIQEKLVRSFFDERIATLEAIAASPSVQSATPAIALPHLRAEENRLREQIDGLYFDDLKGKVYTTSGTTFSIRDRYYYPMVERGETFITKVLPSRATGRDVIILAVPVRNGRGEHVGAIGAALQVAQVQAVIAGLSVGAGGFAALIDEDGAIISARPEFAADLAVLRRNASAGEGASDLTRLMHNNVSYLAQRRSLALRGWSLAIVRPESEIVAAAARLRTASLAIFAVAIAATLIFSYFSARSLSEPIERLAQAVTRLGGGDLSARAEESSEDEIGDLGLAFNRMALAIRERDAERDRSETLLRETLKRMQETEQLLSSIADNIPGGAITRHIRNTDGSVQFLYVSRSIYGILGHTAEEALANPMLLFGTVDPDDMRIHLEKVRQKSQTLETLDSLVRQRHKDGTPLYVQVRAQPYREPDGAIRWDSVLLDVTDRVRQENMLIEQRAQIEALFNSAREPIFSLDSARRLLAFNPEFARLIKTQYGLTVQEGARLPEFIPDEKGRAVWGVILDELDARRTPNGAAAYESAAIGGRWYDISSHLISGRDRGSLGSSYFMQDVTERLELIRREQRERDRQRTAELEQKRIRALALLHGQEEERKRIAKELHDGVGQQVSATLLGLDNIKGLLEDQRIEEGFQLIQRVRANVLDTIDEIKSIAQYLMPNSLFAFGLAAALRQRTELIQSLSGLHILFEENLGDARFDEELEVSVFRIVQEGLNNILKHAHAKRCWVRVKRMGPRMIAIVADDGRGFDPRTSGDARSNGLFFMRERAELLGGRLRIRSRPGRGSRLEFSTPLR